MSPPENKTHPLPVIGKTDYDPSNPEGGAMWDFDIGRTIGIMARTMPFILLRMAVYFGITLAVIAGTGGTQAA